MNRDIIKRVSDLNKIDNVKIQEVIIKNLDWFLNETKHYPVFFDYQEFKCVLESSDDVCCLLTLLMIELMK